MGKGGNIEETHRAELNSTWDNRSGKKMEGAEKYRKDVKEKRQKGPNRGSSQKRDGRRDPSARRGTQRKSFETERSGVQVS